MAKPLKRSAPQKAKTEAEAIEHVIGKNYLKGAPGGAKLRVICDTEPRGFPEPDNMSPEEAVINAGGGKIRLWTEGSTLRFRFQDQSLTFLDDVETKKDEIRKLLADSILLWGKSNIPITFAEDDTFWDFEIVVRENDRCNLNGCVLASAFFPDGGRHEVVLYPILFEQPEQEQIETLAHEIGHVFGLRHFFAQELETNTPSVVFGTHVKFSIMNYGADSKMTDADRSDLKTLYQKVWSGELTKINGTSIQLVRPFSTTILPAGSVVPVSGPAVPVESIPQIAAAVAKIYPK